VRTVLITGAAGFCATHLARRLCDLGGMRLVGLDRNAPAAAHAGLWGELAVADIADAAALDALLRRVRPEWVFHLAGRMTGSPDELFAANAQGTRCVLDGVRRSAPEAAVLVVGSAAEYGWVDEADLPVREDQPCRPSAAYGRSKLAATRVALDARRRAHLRVVIARPFNVVGAGVPPSLVVGALVDRLKGVVGGHAPALRVGRLDTQRDFIAVDDLVDAYVRMLSGEHWGEIMNVCSGVPTSIGTVVNTLIRASAQPVRVEVDPLLVRTDDVLVSYGSGEKARRLLGFTPATSLEQSLADAWRGWTLAPAPGAGWSESGRSPATPS